jgi:hypothetical protein
MGGPPGPVHVTVTALHSVTNLSACLTRIEQNLRILLGRNARPYVHEDYRWSPPGNAGDRGWEQAYTFRRPGKYQVSLDYVISIGAVNAAPITHCGQKPNIKPPWR